MTQPISYVELNSPDLEATNAFFGKVFGWSAQPFAAPDYLVAPHGDAPGVDAGLLTSRDGQPRTVPVIRVEDLDAVLESVAEHGGTLVVPPFVLTGVGRGCYVVDPTGLLLGLHCYEAS